MPAMSDVVIIVKNQGRIFLAGPPLVKAATGEVVDEETLGGGEMHTSVSGVADHLATSDAHAIRLAREAILDLGSTTPKALPPVSVQLEVKLILSRPLEGRFDRRLILWQIWMRLSRSNRNRRTI